MNESNRTDPGGKNAPQGGGRPLTYRQKLLMGYTDPGNAADQASPPGVPVPPSQPYQPLPPYAPLPPTRLTRAKRVPEGIKPEKDVPAKKYKAGQKKASRAEAKKTLDSANTTSRNQLADAKQRAETQLTEARQTSEKLVADAERNEYSAHSREDIDESRCKAGGI